MFIVERVSALEHIFLFKRPRGFWGGDLKRKNI